MSNNKTTELILKIKYDLKKISSDNSDMYLKFTHLNDFFLQLSDDPKSTTDFINVYQRSEDFYNKLNFLAQQFIELISLAPLEIKNKDYVQGLLVYQDDFNQILNNLHELKISSEDIKNKSVLVNSSNYEYLSGLVKNINHFVLTIIKKEEFATLIDKISEYFIRKDKLKIHKKINGLNSNVLYHGVNLNIMVDILKRGSILGYTSHRYWDEGRRYKESDPKYRGSYWMKGISMTRDLSYALNWRPFIFVFNKDIVEKQHKIQLYNWFAHGERVPKSKNEREEFIVLNKTNKTFLNRDNQEYIQEYNDCLEHYNKMRDNDPEKNEYKTFLDQLEKGKMNYDLNEMRKPEGELLLEDSLVGIIIDAEYMSYISTHEEDLNFIINHPKFLGYVNHS